MNNNEPNAEPFLQQKSTQIAAFATGRNTLILFALWILFQVVLAQASNSIAAASDGASVLDLGCGYSADAAYTQYLDKYSAAARTTYLYTECLDLLYPLCYGLFFACLLSFALRGSRFLYLNLLPIFAITFDYLENVGVFALLLSYPTHLPFMAWWASSFGVIKWLFASASVVIFVAGLISRLFRKNTQ